MVNHQLLLANLLCHQCGKKLNVTIIELGGITDMEKFFFFSISNLYSINIIGKNYHFLYKQLAYYQNIWTCLRQPVLRLEFFSKLILKLINTKFN